MSMEIWGCQCLKCIKIFSLPKLMEIKVHNNDLERFELEESNLHYLCITEKHISEFNLLPLKNLKKLCECLDSTESCVHVFQFYVFQFFFFFYSYAWTVTSYGFALQETKITIHILFITIHSTVYAQKILKMGLTVLFTHLKIILLQYFQFSVSATISSI